MYVKQAECGRGGDELIQRACGQERTVRLREQTGQIRTEEYLSRSRRSRSGGKILGDVDGEQIQTDRHTAAAGKI